MIRLSTWLRVNHMAKVRTAQQFTSEKVEERVGRVKARNECARTSTKGLAVRRAVPGRHVLSNIVLGHTEYPRGSACNTSTEIAVAGACRYSKRRGAVLQLYCGVATLLGILIEPT
jgi:hypothetical protein